MDIEQFKQLPVMGILRGIEIDMIESLVETIVSAGLETIEIAMNTPGASELISRIAKKSDKRLTIGAGTVLTMDDLHSALDAGATFIVLPTIVHNVVNYCIKKAIPVFPGAFTPQEIYDAWNEGATMVKVFPAKFFGPAYLKEIKGSFQDVELLACGGITPKNIHSFFLSGASAVAFGGSIFRKEWLNLKHLFQIEESIRTLITKFKQYPKSHLSP